MRSRLQILAIGLPLAWCGCVAPEPAATKALTPVYVTIETSLGKIKLELYPDKAPLSVDNFLRYVDDKHYDGLIFHRVNKKFMIQGGGYEPGLKERRTRKSTLKNEAGNGLTNRRAMVAMARTTEPDSASAQFFINTVDNPLLDRSTDEAGYAVFGKVIEGMDVVDAIAAVETEKLPQTETHPEFEWYPKQDIVIYSIRRSEK